MNALIIDIRDTCLRAALSNDGVLEYCRTFDFEPLTPLTETGADTGEEPTRKHPLAEDNPYLIYFDTEEKNPWDLALKQIIGQIRSDIKNSIDSTHLIIPSDEVTIATHQLPKMSRQDAQKLIGRKITAETKEEFPPFTIIPAASDQKTQTWCSLYVPTATLRDYHKAFSACRMRLSSITTPVNAMIDAFRSVREAIFNAHAIFEIQRGFIEAWSTTTGAPLVLSPSRPFEAPPRALRVLGPKLLLLSSKESDAAGAFSRVALLSTVNGAPAKIFRVPE